jgi:hypothetical protein
LAVGIGILIREEFEGFVFYFLFLKASQASLELLILLFQPQACTTTPGFFVLEENVYVHVCVVQEWGRAEETRAWGT